MNIWIAILIPIIAILVNAFIKRFVGAKKKELQLRSDTGVSKFFTVDMRSNASEILKEIQEAKKYEKIVSEAIAKISSNYVLVSSPAGTGLDFIVKQKEKQIGLEIVEKLDHLNRERLAHIAQLNTQLEKIVLIHNSPNADAIKRLTNGAEKINNVAIKFLNIQNESLKRMTDSIRKAISVA